MNKESTQDDEDARKDTRLNNILLIAVGGVLILWIAITWTILKIYDGVNSANELGDTFGAVNALFTSLAFAFLIYTALLQKRELEYQRRELKETKEEIAKSAQAQQMLVELTNQQLELQREIRMSQVFPELYLASTAVNWITKPGVGYVLKLEFGTKYNRVRITRFEITGKDYGFKCINEDEITSRYFETRQTIYPEFFRGDGKNFHPYDMQIKVYYEDIDKNPYYQIVSFQNNSQFIGTPKRAELLL